MVYKVSVRDTDYWDRQVRKKLPLDLDSETRENSRIIAQVIPLAKPLLSMFSIDSQEIQYIADAVAYLLRTDVVKRIPHCSRAIFLPPEIIPKLPGESGSQIRLMNDPSLITPSFKFRESQLYQTADFIGAEWFRCYSATISETPGLTEKLTNDRNAFTPGFALADVTTFLLEPSQLIDYTYTSREIGKFEARVERDLASL